MTVNASHDGNAQQFSIAAAVDAGDTSGKSSRFTSSEAALVELLDADDATLQLVIEIDGKQYRGNINHDHDHHEHDADHEG